MCRLNIVIVLIMMSIIKANSRAMLSIVDLDIWCS